MSLHCSKLAHDSTVETKFSDFINHQSDASFLSFLGKKGKKTHHIGFVMVAALHKSALEIAQKRGYLLPGALLVLVFGIDDFAFRHLLDCV